ncbi:MAG: alpha/beta hydrolase-fold protein [Candidatus Azobacteroides sp.]|nr:alpha/beta hydrolase-fold protein [Candidatus Azobacteroides sp.]
MRLSFCLFVFLFIVRQIFSQNTVCFSEIKAPYMTVSPTIAEWENMDDVSLNNELDVFWTNASKNGLPLVEKDSLYDDYVYVTFIYNSSETAVDVKLFIPGIYDENRFGDLKMYRLKNTGVYYRCYLLPDDVCMSYRFDVTDKKTGKTVKDLDRYNDNRIPKGERKDFSYSVLDLSRNHPDRNEQTHAGVDSRIDLFNINSRLLNNIRNVYVYLPPGYDGTETYPAVWLFDAFVYMNRVEVPVVLDNLIADGMIRPVIAVMFDNPTSESRYTEYALNFDFMNAFVSEFVPVVRERYTMSSNPADNIIGGMSYGGLNAAFIAFHHPGMFGKVLSQSGSFWRDLILKDTNGNEVRNDWLIRQFDTAVKRNLKLFLDWGLQENMVLGSNRTFVKVLNRKGYEFEFVEFDGWHNWANTRKTFPVGLMYLMN